MALRVAGFDFARNWFERESLKGTDTVVADLTYDDLAFDWVVQQSDVIFRGIAHDILFVALVAGILCVFGRTLFQIAVILLVAFLAANIEHIKYNFDHIQLSTIGLGFDQTFIRGSLTRDVIKYAVVIAGAGVFGLVFGMQRVLRPGAGYLAIAIVLAAFGYGFKTFPDAPDWMQTTPLLPIAPQQNLPTLAAKPPDQAVAWTAQPVRAVGQYNVLTVYLEGLSHASLERGDMRTLSSLAEQGVQFENYVSRQIITANGLYAAMTGDTPSFLRRFIKWEEMEADSQVAAQSLPRVFAEEGYQTSYLQSAQLGFMAKDAKLQHMGFDDIRGDAAWDTAHSRNGWGVDDLTLIENSLAEIDNLSVNGPWFVSTLTTGTHSPYNVPGLDNPTRYDALQAADRAVSVLIEGLRARDQLDNTVVIITSDEGRESTGRDGFLGDMALNRLPLIVLHPDMEGAVITHNLLNTDLRDITLLLSHQIDADTFVKSLPLHEDIVFGNFITGKIFWYDAVEKSLAGCRTRSFDCQVWEDQATLFGPTSDIPERVHMPAFSQLIRAHDRVPVQHSP
ncbi:LTA synthase family protein [Yoonia sp. R2331]|uniref:LTA synthase family protein n=1 Tax=Yoonia sp. R2331 TaxID=3237238 RepID=UPI0034E3B010